ncbi:MAG: hypothetical protein M0Z71_01575 [Nitrospiraceae bacterium]|nr:hypothetical protein [Nitrospiraceae bacterium]
MKKNWLLLVILFSLFFISSPIGISQVNATVLDDFNRPNGSIGGNWTVQSGSFNIVSNAVQGGPSALATYNSLSSNVLEADVTSTGTSIQYEALVLAYANLDNNIFIKVQTQGGGTTFTNAACYQGNNGSTSTFGLGFFNLTAAFTTAHMRAAYDPGTSSVTITFSNIDGGSGTQQYVCTGAPSTGGSGVGIGAYNIASGTLDNFAADVVAPNTVTSVPTLTEWGMIVFIFFAGLGSVYYLRRQRRVKS